ncbi:MAG: class I SAM-dependent DNA methyltransferase [Thiotrichaceae bacterium]|nr:class I SAM-dependent DNA methyltransferase [Thiotrichaceae bacterium]
MTHFTDKANLIWEVADLLRGDYKQSDYGKVILPLTVLRRLDCVLAPTKQKVLAAYPKFEESTEKVRDIALNKIAGFNFHNHSEFDFAQLIEDPEHIAGNLGNYINGYSASAREIIEYFNFNIQIERMNDPKSNILFQVVKKFADIDLSDMDSMQMGYVFEDLIRRFAEQSNETAGEHFTPREVIKLMVNVLFNEDTEVLTKKGIVRELYDPACGTGGMLSVGEQYLRELNPAARLVVFGQEINPESYAICKSDMLIKGQNPSNIKFGNSFTDDGLADEKFSYMLSNPPFGVDWKKASKVVKNECDSSGFAGRFGAGLPRINDGSLLFLQHMISKMKRPEQGGSRIGIVFNGSPLFTGQAGSGESEIRKWIIENDWLEAIIALPDQLFYNTGISTYVWILSNHKSKQRKGKVQLINATGQKDEALMAAGECELNRFWDKMSRSLGSKRKQIVENGVSRGIGLVARLYGDFEEGEFVKIVPNDFFAYWRVTVEQPLRDEDGEIVQSRGKVKADTGLRDYENIAFLRKDKHGALVAQSIEDYFEREVKPHLPDAWVDEGKTKVGYEINFTKYFYEFKPLRSLDEIKADILALEQSSLALEQEVLD